MAEPSGLCARDLLPPTFRGIDAVAAREKDRDPSLQRQPIPALAMGVVGDKASEAVRSALDLDVFELIAQGWAKARELEAYADETKHPPGETSTLFLGKHDLSIEVHPEVTVLFGGLGKLTLRFTLELSVAIELAELTIVSQHITEIGKTQCSLSAVLKYGETALHEPLESRKWTLAKSVRLDPAMPLAPWRARHPAEG
ncbi:MAG TPA: hypothetical protein VGI95_10830 [Caulobacteraceae bacterium]|jgi:hypothetical protein